MAIFLLIVHHQESLCHFLFTVRTKGTLFFGIFYIIDQAVLADYSVIARFEQNISWLFVTNRTNLLFFTDFAVVGGVFFFSVFGSLVFLFEVKFWNLINRENKIFVQKPKRNFFLYFLLVNYLLKVFLDCFSPDKMHNQIRSWKPNK